MSKRPLTPVQREAVFRETFEALTAVGFMNFKAEELTLGNELTEEDRRLYFREFEKSYIAGFQRRAANASDDRLLDDRQYWTEKANAMGLKEWQQVFSKGRGAKPFYETVRQELAERQMQRRQKSRRKGGAFEPER